MPDRSTREGLGRALMLVFLATCGPLRAQILDWDAAIGGLSGGDANFTAVDARPEDGSGQVASALLAGTFQGSFQMDVAPPPILPGPLANPTGADGVVVRMDRQATNPANWIPIWYAQAGSAGGNVELTDLAVSEDGKFFVSGRFGEDVDFTPAGPGVPSFTAPGFTSGFVAWGDADSGIWEGAFETIGLEAESIALGPGPDPEIYLTGPGVLARKYDSTGAPLWNQPAQANITGLTDIALLANPDVPDLYVLTESSGFAGFPDDVVILHQLTKDAGTVTWQRPMGGLGTDSAGGLAVPADGDPRLAFTTEDANPNFGPDPLPALPALGIDHSLMLRVDPVGNLVWAAPLGLADSPGASMQATDVAVDRSGNAFASAGFHGSWLIESPDPVLADRDAAVFGVDATGVLFDFHQSTGEGIDSPRAVSAPVRGLLVTVGSYDAPSIPANPQSIFGSITLPAVAANEPRAFFAVADPFPAQQRFILAPNPTWPTPPSVDDLTKMVHQLGGQVYHVIRSDSRGEIAVAAFIDDEDLDALQNDDTLKLEPDFTLTLAGTNADAGWALEHLNDATNTSSSPFTFTYPEPGHPVYLYLLDTAVGSATPAVQANIDTWFSSNTNLAIEATTLVRGVGDPLVSSLFQHGTEMLSLIGGPGAGAAVGTPIVLKNFDFYPNGASTTASLLASAIYDAIDYHAANGDCFPGLIVVASSSVAAAMSTTLSDAVDEAIAEGIPVVLSAGNSNADASAYVPASKGSVSGVICAGASKADRTRWTQSAMIGSNFGSPVDLYTPGAGVRVIDYSSPLGGSYGSFTGTSASAALTGAVAATYLSVNPWSTPADLETALTGDVYTDGVSGLDVLQLDSAGPDFYLDYDDWTAWFDLTDLTHAGDDDGDGWTNIEEFFHGLKPTEWDQMGSQVAISYDHATSKVTFSFTVSSVLLDASNLGTLLDGTTYEVTDSTTLASFGTSGASLTVGGSTGGQTTLSQTETASTECFMRVEFSPASPSP